MGGNSFAKRKISYLLLFLDCRQVLVPDRLLHRHRRIHQVLLRIQNYSEVTSKHRETGEIQQKNHKQKQKGEQQSGNGRPFATSSRMVRGVHRQSRGHRNVRARRRSSGVRIGTLCESGVKIFGNTVFILTSQKTEIEKYACEPR